MGQFSGATENGFELRDQSPSFEANFDSDTAPQTDSNGIRQPVASSSGSVTFDVDAAMAEIDADDTDGDSDLDEAIRQSIRESSQVPRNPFLSV